MSAPMTWRRSPLVPRVLCRVVRCSDHPTPLEDHIAGSVPNRSMFRATRRRSGGSAPWVAPIGKETVPCARYTERSRRNPCTGTGQVHETARYIGRPDNSRPADARTLGISSAQPDHAMPHDRSLGTPNAMAPGWSPDGPRRLLVGSVTHRSGADSSQTFGCCVRLHQPSLAHA